ncbi:MAG: hypothetical protein WC655_12520 [Candidatus Hydrogenedentales bacterium]|jgi:hypothetical protein
MEIPVRTKTYSILDWYVYRRDAHAIVYRPSLTTLLKRLQYPLFAGLFSVGVWYLSRDTSVRSLDGILFRDLVQGLIVLLCALGALPVLAALIEELRIGCDAGRNLVIRKRSLWSTAIATPISKDSVLTVCAREALARVRRRGPLRSTGYTWTVTLTANPIMQGMEAICLEFLLDHQQQRPLENRPFPPRVQEFVDAVSAITGVRVDPMPTIADAQRTARGWATSRRVSFPSVQVSKREIPVDELPPEVRAKVQALVEDAQQKRVSGFTQATTLHQEFKVMGKDGTVRTYGSLEELPPEIRATIERFGSGGNAR